MKILITGAPGWLGSRMVEALAGNISELKQYLPAEPISEIRCLVQPSISTEGLTKIHENVQVIEQDILAQSGLDEFFKDSENSILIHMAGIIHPSKGVKQIFDVNVRGTENLLGTAIKHKVKRIVAVSSNSPIGTNPTKDHLFTEESPYNPYMSYGKSKMEMEIMLNEAFRKGLIECVIMRPCWFYGPGQPPRQSLFFSMIKEGKGPIVGGGENNRSMSYVDNSCQAILLAISSSKANGETYWIADEQPYTMNQITDTVEQLLEQEFCYEVGHGRLRLPGVASEVAWLVDWALQKVGLYHQKIHVLSEMNKTIACSIDKAKSELGYQPHIELEEGMRRSLKWMFENGQTL